MSQVEVMLVWSGGGRPPWKGIPRCAQCQDDDADPRFAWNIAAGPLPPNGARLRYTRWDCVHLVEEPLELVVTGQQLDVWDNAHSGVSFVRCRLLVNRAPP